MGTLALLGAVVCLVVFVVVVGYLAHWIAGVFKDSND
jgi:hypothetical protein